jgi:hypothetical protein
VRLAAESGLKASKAAHLKFWRNEEFRLNDADQALNRLDQLATGEAQHAGTHHAVQVARTMGSLTTNPTQRLALYQRTIEAIIGGVSSQMAGMAWLAMSLADSIGGLGNPGIAQVVERMQQTANDEHSPQAGYVTLLNRFRENGTDPQTILQKLAETPAADARTRAATYQELLPQGPASAAMVSASLQSLGDEFAADGNVTQHLQRGQRLNGAVVNDAVHNAINAFTLRRLANGDAFVVGDLQPQRQLIDALTDKAAAAALADVAMREAASVPGNQRAQRWQQLQGVLNETLHLVGAPHEIHESLRLDTLGSCCDNDATPANQAAVLDRLLRRVTNEQGRELVTAWIDNLPQLGGTIGTHRAAMLKAMLAAGADAQQVLKQTTGDTSDNLMLLARSASACARGASMLSVALPTLRQVATDTASRSLGSVAGKTNALTQLGWLDSLSRAGDAVGDNATWTATKNKGLSEVVGWMSNDQPAGADQFNRLVGVLVGGSEQERQSALLDEAFNQLHGSSDANTQGWSGLRQQLESTVPAQADKRDNWIHFVRTTIMSKISGRSPYSAADAAATVKNLVTGDIAGSDVSSLQAAVTLAEKLHNSDEAGSRVRGYQSWQKRAGDNEPLKRALLQRELDTLCEPRIHATPIPPALEDKPSAAVIASYVKDSLDGAPGLADIAVDEMAKAARRDKNTSLGTVLAATRATPSVTPWVLKNVASDPQSLSDYVRVALNINQAAGGNLDQLQALLPAVRAKTPPDKVAALDLIEQFMGRSYQDGADVADTARQALSKLASAEGTAGLADLGLLMMGGKRSAAEKLQIAADVTAGMRRLSPDDDTADSITLLERTRAFDGPTPELLAESLRCGLGVLALPAVKGDRFLAMGASMLSTALSVPQQRAISREFVGLLGSRAERHADASLSLASSLLARLPDLEFNVQDGLSRVMVKAVSGLQPGAEPASSIANATNCLLGMADAIAEPHDQVQIYRAGLDVLRSHSEQSQTLPTLDLIAQYAHRDYLDDSDVPGTIRQALAKLPSTDGTLGIANLSLLLMGGKRSANEKLQIAADATAAMRRLSPDADTADGITLLERVMAFDGPGQDQLAESVRCGMNVMAAATVKGDRFVTMGSSLLGTALSVPQQRAITRDFVEVLGSYAQRHADASLALGAAVLARLTDIQFSSDDNRSRVLANGISKLQAGTEPASTVANASNQLLAMAGSIREPHDQAEIYRAGLGVISPRLDRPEQADLRAFIEAAQRCMALRLSDSSNEATVGQSVVTLLAKQAASAEAPPLEWYTQSADSIANQASYPGEKIAMQRLFLAAIDPMMQRLAPDHVKERSRLLTAVAATDPQQKHYHAAILSQGLRTLVDQPRAVRHDAGWYGQQLASVALRNQAADPRQMLDVQRRTVEGMRAAIEHQNLEADLTDAVALLEAIPTMSATPAEQMAATNALLNAANQQMANVNNDDFLRIAAQLVQTGYRQSVNYPFTAPTAASLALARAERKHEERLLPGLRLVNDVTRQLNNPANNEAACNAASSGVRQMAAIDLTSDQPPVDGATHARSQALELLKLARQLAKDTGDPVATRIASLTGLRHAAEVLRQTDPLGAAVLQAAVGTDELSLVDDSARPSVLQAAMDGAISALNDQAAPTIHQWSDIAQKVSTAGSNSSDRLSLSRLMTQAIDSYAREAGDEALAQRTGLVSSVARRPLMDKDQQLLTVQTGMSLLQTDKPEASTLAGLGHTMMVSRQRDNYGRNSTGKNPVDSLAVADSTLEALKAAAHARAEQAADGNADASVPLPSGLVSNDVGTTADLIYGAEFLQRLGQLRTISDADAAALVACGLQALGDTSSAGGGPLVAIARAMLEQKAGDTQQVVTRMLTQEARTRAPQAASKFGFLETLDRTRFDVEAAKGPMLAQSLFTLLGGTSPGVEGIAEMAYASSEKLAQPTDALRVVQLAMQQIETEMQAEAAEAEGEGGRSFGEGARRALLEGAKNLAGLKLSTPAAQALLAREALVCLVECQVARGELLLKADDHLAGLKLTPADVATARKSWLADAAKVAAARGDEATAAELTRRLQTLG